MTLGPTFVLLGLLDRPPGSLARFFTVEERLVLSSGLRILYRATPKK